MNKHDKEIEIWKAKQYFERDDQRHMNCIRINPSHSYEHEKAKFDECWKLAKERKKFICEGKLVRNGERPDITVLDTDGFHYHIEILCSETEERFSKKDYPFEIKQVKVGDKKCMKMITGN